MNRNIEKDYNQYVKALIQLIPSGIGSAIDVLIDNKIRKIQEKKKKLFFDELSKGNINLTKEIIVEDDFLHSFFATYKYALSTRNDEKIKWFAAILKIEVIDNKIDYDQYDEFIKTIDNLSVNDIFVLRRIEIFEQKHNTNIEVDLFNIWNREIIELSLIKLSITKDEFDVIILRLIGFGLFEKRFNFNNNGAIVVTDIYSAKIGRLTIRYHNLVKCLKDKIL